VIGLLPMSVPVAPGGDQARQWLLDELAKPVYQEARPSLFDLIAQAVLQWFEDLFTKGDSAAPPVLLVAALAVLATLLVVALLLYGAPRLNRRSRVTATLFGADDRRSADELRRAATAALAAGDVSLAILERFRALARGLDERTVVAIFPGTTADTFAARAAEAFPDERVELASAAQVFDGVRYAGRAGTRTEAEAIASLDGRISAARPQFTEPLVPTA
jgi:hypothetical protein